MTVAEYTPAFYPEAERKLLAQIEKDTNPFDHEYHNLLRKLLNEGVESPDRTGTGTLRLAGHMMRFDLAEGFPLLTTKKLYTKAIFHELLWFLKGGDNVRYLQEHGVRIWNEWADADGYLGPVYGKQWRSWPDENGRAIDQIALVIDALKNNPDSRRHIVSSWNVAQIDKMALPPCHLLFQFHVIDKRLSCQLYQRSADCFLGVPFNIASYAALTLMIAQITDSEPGDFIHVLGDTHLYLNHLDHAREQLGREPRKPPKLDFARDVSNIDDFVYEDFVVSEYNPHPSIKADISV